MEPAETPPPATEPKQPDPVDSETSSNKPRLPQKSIHTRNLHQLEVRTGGRAGNRRVHILRPREFRQFGRPDHLVATDELLRPKGTIGAVFGALRRFLIGRPIATEMAMHERL